MRARLYKILRWILRKTVFSTVVIALVLTVQSLWLFVHDPVDYNTNREKRIALLEAQEKKLIAERDGKLADLNKLRENLRDERMRETTGKTAITALRAQQSRWQRWFGDAEKQRQIDERIAHIQSRESETRQHILDLQRDTTRKDWERDGVQIDLEHVQTELKLLRKAQSPSLHYADVAWHQSRWYLLLGVVWYFFGALVWRLFLYFIIAPAFVRGSALRFAEASPRFPHVVKSSTEVQVPLWPGEVLRVRRGFLQSVDIGMMERRRVLFDWFHPFTSWFSGLSWLKELRHGQARGEQRASLSAPEEADAEFSLIHIPEGGSLMVRPRFLAATVQPADQRVRLRMRWRLFHRNAWAAGQWRFAEVFGPGRVVLYGPPPSRIEVLSAPDAGASSSRRLRGRAIVGFSPDVQYGRVRTDSFWRYLRHGQNLLDALFIGPGLLVCHETPRRRGRISRIWSGMMHAFGL